MLKIQNPNSTYSATVSEEVFAFLSRLPKAVLIDCYCQAMALNRGFCDDIVPLDEIKADVDAMLALRRES